MQDISEIIKEAKPLYFARKKRNNRIKASLAVLVCSVFISLAMPRYQSSNSAYYWDLGIEDDETVTYVENFGLPVDEYGLLLVG